MNQHKNKMMKTCAMQAPVYASARVHVRVCAHGCVHVRARARPIYPTRRLGRRHNVRVVVTILSAHTGMCVCVCVCVCVATR